MHSESFTVTKFLRHQPSTIQPHGIVTCTFGICDVENSKRIELQT